LECRLSQFTENPSDVSYHNKNQCLETVCFKLQTEQKHYPTSKTPVKISSKPESKQLIIFFLLYPTFNENRPIVNKNALKVPWPPRSLGAGRQAAELADECNYVRTRKRGSVDQSSERRRHTRRRRVARRSSNSRWSPWHLLHPGRSNVHPLSPIRTHARPPPRRPALKSRKRPEAILRQTAVNFGRKEIINLILFSILFQNKNFQLKMLHFVKKFSDKKFQTNQNLGWEAIAPVSYIATLLHAYRFTCIRVVPTFKPHLACTGTFFSIFSCSHAS